MSRYSNDPRIIKARFNSTCKESGKAITKGEDIVYYPSNKSVYKLDTKQAQEFFSWQQDVEWLGANY